MLKCHNLEKSFSFALPVIFTFALRFALSILFIFFHFSVTYPVQVFSKENKFLSEAHSRCAIVCVLTTRHAFLLFNKWIYPKKEPKLSFSITGLKWRCWGCTTRSIGSCSIICWDIQHWQIRMESEPQKGAFSLALVALLLTLTTAQQRMCSTPLHIFKIAIKVNRFNVETRGIWNPRSIYINLVVVPVIVLVCYFGCLLKSSYCFWKEDMSISKPI